MKIRLVETTVIGPDEYKKSNFLTESDQTVFVEEKGIPKVEYKAKAVYTFPISKPDQENLNGRIYIKKLWEKTELEMKNSSTFGLMDHPKDEGSTKDIWCVWRNLRLNEKKDLVVADAYLIGKWGEMVKEILDAGGKVGLSTSGFGEMLEDNKTINPDTYELERVADFVFNPSYEVYGSQENIINQEEKIMKTEELSTLEEEKKDKEKKKKDDIEVEDKKKKTDIEIEDKEKKKDDTEVEDKKKKDDTEVEDKEKKKDKENDEKEEPKENKKEAFLAKSFKLNMLSSFKQAKKLENAEERISHYSDLLLYFEDGIEDELQKEIQEELEKEKKAIEDNIITEQEKIKNEAVALKKENAELLQKFTDSLDLLDSLKVYSKKLKEMYDLVSAEKNGMVTASEYREAQVYLEGIEEEKTNLEQEVIKLREKNRNLLARQKQVRENTKLEEDLVENITEDKIVIDYDKVNPEVIKYYSNLEYSNPAVVSFKEDILRCRTLMEAQRTVLRLRPLWEGNNSAYDRKVSREKATYIESSKQKLNIKEGWL